MGWLEMCGDPSRHFGFSIDELWRSVDVQPVPGVPAPVEWYLNELRELYVNGGAEFARFTLHGNPDFEWLASAGRWSEMAFFTRLFRHPGVRAVLPEVTALKKVRDSAEFKWASTLTLDGVLAQYLVGGGAYRMFPGHAREAKQLGMEVSNALIGDRYEEVLLFTCWDPWSPWFQDIAWDSTTLLIDRRHRMITVLCATDTD